MKISGEVTIAVNPDPSGVPTINGTAKYSLDCSEAEHALAFRTFQKISDDWLEVKQEFVKSLVCTASFKDMITAGWAVLTQKLKAS
jgi:hypothetical protein